VFKNNDVGRTFWQLAGKEKLVEIASNVRRLKSKPHKSLNHNNHQNDHHHHYDNNNNKHA